MDDVPPSLACLASIPFTGAFKTPPTLPAGKQDAARLRTIGIAGLSAGILRHLHWRVVGKGLVAPNQFSGQYVRVEQYVQQGQVIRNKASMSQLKEQLFSYEKERTM